MSGPLGEGFLLTHTVYLSTTSATASKA